MATGFPTKANWAAGDILTAAQMDDLAGTVNLFSNASATTGSQLVSNAAGTSFAYQPTPSASNPVLNSAMQVWQRYATQVTGTITAATSGATTAYVVANSFVVGQYVTVTGMTPTTLNGAGVVTVASGVGFTISATTTGTFSAGGIATGSPYVSLAASSGVIYAADRWCSASGVSQALTITRQTTSDTTNLPNIQYCSRIQRNSGQTGTSTINYYQNFESVNSIPLAGKAITISYYARAGANYSATSNQLNAIVYSGTGTDQNILTSFTGSTTVASTSATLTTTWQRFTFTGTVASTATQIAVGFSGTPTGTAGTNDYYEVTGVQIDVGSVALPFRTYGATLQGELAACQRYYQTNSRCGYLGNVTVSNAYYQQYTFVVLMRTAPTVTLTSVAASLFSTTTTAGAISADTMQLACVCSATGSAGYFINSFTASAEL